MKTSAKKRRAPEEFSIAFLDVICCGFGAVILLLMITKTVQPQVLEAVAAESTASVELLEDQRYEIRGKTVSLNRKLTSKQQQLSELKSKVAILQGEARALESDKTSLERAFGDSLEAKENLQLALQKLTEEQKRLQLQQSQIANDVIGGIPVDSEYIVFVVDTSGSMTSDWSKVMEQLLNAIKVYPTIKGVQVLNGGGKHMRPSTEGFFLPGTEFKSSQFISQLNGFKNTFDESDLTPGIIKAVELYSKADKQVSIYVFADDISTAVSPQAILNKIKRVNYASSSGLAKTRIHVVGFPNLLNFLRNPMMRAFDIGDRVASFAHFARSVAEQNGGAFIAISE
jgi:hypothetical protein